METKDVETVIKSIPSENCYTFPQYLHLTEKLVEEGKSSGDQTDKNAEYTKLNLQRMNRWVKTGHINEPLRSLLQNTHKKMQWIVISETWCGDAAQNIPLLQKMHELNPEKIDLKIVFRDENPELMNLYLSNGAKSIPKLIVLDESRREIFNWGPRPKFIQQQFEENKKAGTMPVDEFKVKMHRWYVENKGEELQKDLYTLLEKSDLQ